MGAVSYYVNLLRSRLEAKVLLFSCTPKTCMLLWAEIAEYPLGLCYSFSAGFSIVIAKGLPLINEAGACHCRGWGNFLPDDRSRRVDPSEKKALSKEKIFGTVCHHPLPSLDRGLDVYVDSRALSS